MACVVTDKDLNVIEKGPDIVIHHSDETIDGMCDWAKKHFSGPGGLIEQIRESKVETKECEDKMLAFIKKHVEKGNPC
eukprot:TRINITY_DN2222_c0_g1_i1.p2 TRINITY_DN2222_c0_g1~~TRINITY_DN2222_c0_g1_i1.p2  ORF type:complete len:78 (-),score=21.32 TRINITY_DN2222_c0_g1_i1:25-258(-)